MRYRLVNIGLPNKMAIPFVRMTDGDIFGAEALIGMDVICVGDFAVTNKDGKTIMAFQIPSIRRYDFVEQMNQSTKTSKTGRAIRQEKNTDNPMVRPTRTSQLLPILPLLHITPKIQVADCVKSW